MDTLRHLKNKSQIMTSDILCAIDNIMDLTNFQQNVIIVRYLVTLFMLINCSIDTLDIHQIIFKVGLSRHTTIYRILYIKIESCPSQVTPPAGFL